MEICNDQQTAKQLDDFWDAEKQIGLESKHLTTGSVHS